MRVEDLELAKARRDALDVRRKALQSALNGKSALIFSGYELPRTAESVCYPFRPSSHSIYFGGKLPSASVILVSPGETVLYTYSPSLAEQVWEGNGESGSELAQARGFDRHAPLEKLIEDVRRFSSNDLLSLPLLLPDTRIFQEKLLGRELSAYGKDRPLADAVIELRLVQDSFAASQLRHAGRITALAHQRAAESAAAGTSTNTVLAALRSVAAEYGCEESFSPIVSPHGEVLHNSRRGETLEDGDFLLVDYGVETEEGYAGDLTRTWPVGKRHSTLARETYELVLSVQRHAVNSVRPGADYRDIHNVAARKLLEGLRSLDIVRGNIDELFDQGIHTHFFPHGIGHLVGLDVHDMEDLGDLAGYDRGRVRSERFGDSFLRLDRKLKSGMVVSIEPGLYFIPALLQGEAAGRFKAAFNPALLEELLAIRGVRIEDVVLVTNNGAEVLTDGVSKHWDPC